MSAYGPPPSRPTTDLPVLPTQILELKAKDVRVSGVENKIQEGSEKGYLAVYHLTAHTIPPELTAYLYETFQAELEKGMTYPQEYPMTSSGFDVYFLGNDVFVGVLVNNNTITAVSSNIEQVRDGREWNACVGGTYYVKPNYPGRSSHDLAQIESTGGNKGFLCVLHLSSARHCGVRRYESGGDESICNAGFLVPPKFRGLGIATALGQSYIVNAPLLGYKASVFNLVYVNNVASVRIWERLGFLRVGRIPFAGRLKRKEEEGGGEEYVDAWVIYKSFVEGSVYTIE